MGDNSETMDRLYGDCTEVLHSLLDYVHRELKLPTAADAPGGEGTSGAGAPAAAEPKDPEAMRAAAEATRLSKLRDDHQRNLNEISQLYESSVQAEAGQLPAPHARALWRARR